MIRIRILHPFTRTTHREHLCDLHSLWLSFILTETQQALRVEVRNLPLVIDVDWHLIEESPSGFHVSIWIVRREDDAVNANRVRHAQIGLVRQTPATIHRARLLAYVLTSEDSTVKILPKVFL